ncbi:MAG: HAD family hydrolase [Gammaproteobacteria bacterium]|nr:HAD family hydrolase [Gammaproteobacteria bacterium]
MWSGPRNISTALMRAWENRPDTVVVDEPFYASYLLRSGRQHPGRREVMAAQSTDWREVVASLQLPLPAGQQIQYQKQMTHHIDEEMEIDWLAGACNCFLIREPRSMLASLLRVLPDAQLIDTGLVQQLRLFRYLCSVQDRVPPVVDSADLLRNPEGVLRALCKSIGVSFSDRMLCWPPGRRDSDGVWAPYWYASVEQSTGFAPWQPASPTIPSAWAEGLQQCESLYQEIAAHRLEVTDGDR